MKCCICNNRYPPYVVGGTELVVHELATQMRERGHDISVLTLGNRRRSDTTVTERIEVQQMPNFNVYNQFQPVPRSGLKKALFGAIDTFNPLVFLYALRYFATRDFEVVCTNNLKGMGPAVWLAAWLCRIPVVHVIHDYWLVCPTSTMFRNGRACERACAGCHKVSRPKAWMSRLVSSVVGVSRFVLERHRQEGFFGGASLGVVHNARSLFGGARVDASGSAGVRRPLRVGFIGRADLTKGIDMFFDAAASSGLADIELHIAGRDNDGMLDACAKKYPELTLVRHGFMNPAEFYPLIDVVAVTSMWDEPFGMVAFEPWEFSKPTVSFASGGLPEVYDGLDDLVVPRGDTRALGAVLRRFADDPAFYADTARRCHARREHFLPRRQVEQFESVLQAAASREVVRTHDADQREA